jgi:large subunit ribosomal protein L30
MTHLKVTLTRSSIGADERQLATLRGLGLRKIGGSRVLENTPSVRGMVKSVMHLLSVQEVSNG